MSDVGPLDIDPAKLREVRQRKWFYAFELPDGTVTETYIGAEVLPVHTTRRNHLRRIIETRVAEPGRLTALDLASHEGYFSIELARHFAHVRGVEFRTESLAAARLITEVLGISNVEYLQADVQRPIDADWSADFVLVYGLIYHVENPIQVLRLASRLCRQHLLLETQLLPYDVSGRVEDGHYTNLRDVNGVFGLALDYPHGREGGSTEVALVPSLSAVTFLLRMFGFEEIVVLPPGPEDYEQHRRGSRVIIYARKPRAA
jgi:hypothetical protein